MAGRAAWEPELFGLEKVVLESALPGTEIFKKISYCCCFQEFSWGFIMKLIKNTFFEKKKKGQRAPVRANCLGEAGNGTGPVDISWAQQGPRLWKGQNESRARWEGQRGPRGGVKGRDRPARAGRQSEPGTLGWAPTLVH